MEQADRRLAGLPEAEAAQARARALSAYLDWSRGLVTDGERGLFPGAALRQPGAEAQAPAGVGIITLVMAGMMLFFVFFTGLNGAATVLREREAGTLQRLSATGVPILTLLGGKLAGTFLLILLQGGILLLASRLLFRARWGDPRLLVPLLAALAAAATGFGALLAALCRTVRQSGAAIGLVLTLSSMAGGLMTTALPNPPALLRATARWVPQGWGLEAALAAAAGRGAADLAAPLLRLAAFGLLTFAAGTALLQRRLSREAR